MRESEDLQKPNRANAEVLFIFKVGIKRFVYIFELRNLNMRVNEHNQKKSENAKFDNVQIRGSFFVDEQNRFAQRTWLPLEAIAQRCCNNPTIKLRAWFSPPSFNCNIINKALLTIG